MPRSHRAPRRRHPRLHHGRCRGRPGHGARPRDRALGGAEPRPAARRSARLQGSLPRAGAADLVRHQDSRILRAFDRVHGDGPSARRRRGHPRQAEHDGAGDGAVRGQRSSRRRPEPVEARSLRRRLEQRLGGRGGGWLRARHARQRHRRLHQAAGGVLRRRRPQAHVRAGEPCRRDAAVVVDGSPRAVDPNRRRHRAAARDRRGARPARRDVQPPWRSVLPADAGEPGRRSAGRHSRELLLRRDRRRDRRRGPRGGGRPCGPRRARHARSRPRPSHAHGHRQRHLALGVRGPAHAPGARSTARASAGGPSAARGRLPHLGARLSPSFAAACAPHARVHRGSLRGGRRVGRPRDP